MKLKLTKWDPSTIKPTSTILLIGRRGTGKSTLMRDLASHFARQGTIDLALGMSPTEESSESMGSFLHPELIYNEYREDVIVNLMAIQKRQWKRGHGSHVQLYLDDVCYDKQILRTKTMRELFMNGRHRRLGLVLCMQYCMDMPPDLRSNVDVVIAARDSIHSSRSKLHTNFFGFFKSYDEFSVTMDATTNNYEVMVLHNNKGTPSNDIEDCVHWYRASPQLEPFRLGHGAFSTLHTRYYRDREEEFEAIEERRAEEEMKRKRKSAKIEMVVKGDPSGKTIVGR